MAGDVRKLVPPLSWFVQPSGRGPVTWFRRVWDTPIVAHGVQGVWTTVAAHLLGFHDLGAAALAFGLCMLIQAVKLDDHVYGVEWPREVFWRLTISGAVIAWLT